MKRCLIIDDSSVVRKVAKRILSKVDMVVAEASTGVQALGMCAAAIPDTIILDASLTDMAAVDFINQLKAGHPNQPMPRILLCLVEVDLGAIMRARRAGAAGYMLKPFNRSQLLAHFRQTDAIAA